MWPGRWADYLLGFCLTLLLAALALHWAVCLIEDIWQPLAIIVGLVTVGVALVTWQRRRSGGW